MSGLPRPSRLSILIPLYNEEEFISALLTRVLEAPLPENMDRELIIVDDASNDGSYDIAREFATKFPGVIRLLRHEKNRGKGAAIRTAIEQASGDYCIIQDSDLEYDPREYPKVLKPLLEGVADAVYGSRFMAAGERRVLYFWHSVGNHLLTTICNIFADVNLTDMETCYKAFRTSLIKSIPIRSNRFGIEPEITIKLAQRKARIYETPVTYHGRTYEEGKKIGLKDAFAAFYVVLRTRLSNDIYKDSGPETLEALSAAPRFNSWMADTIRPYLGTHILEIGAGIGNLSRYLVPRTSQYVVSDVDPEHLARLASRFQHRPNVRVCFADLGRAECFQSFAGQMQSVVCLNVLEHLEDDVAGLRNIHSALAPGGRAVVLVPNDQRIYGTLDAALGHYRRYSEPELREKMRAIGFHIQDVIAFNRVSRPAWYVSGKLQKATALGRKQMRLFDSLVWLWRKIDSSLPWPPVSLIAIGVKE